MEVMPAKKTSILSTGLAMFAMFFGAGNVIFPLMLGQFAQDRNIYSVLGMIITAVLVPLTGLLAMILFEGNYDNFFRKIGRVPGFVIIFLILNLIGPFAGIPRCITISYSTFAAFGIDHIPGVNLITFSMVSCLLIFALTCRQTKILSVLGKILTPIILLALTVIVVKGFLIMPHASFSGYGRWETFLQGVLEGYNTMDLLASFFFSSVVLVCLRQQFKKEVSVAEKHKMLWMAGGGALVAALLLAAVYVSLSFLAAGFSGTLSDVAPHQLLGTLACHILGPYAGLLVGLVVFLAVLTTEIALAAIFAKFLQETIFRGKISYLLSLVITLSISFAISTLHFDGIAAFIGPILQVCYPALIALAILNILNRAYNFKPVKLVFYSVLAITFAMHFLI